LDRGFGRIESTAVKPMVRLSIDKRKDEVMAEATTKVKTTAKPMSQGSGSFEAKVETPTFGIPKFEFPKFEVPKMEVPAAFRELAERSVTQARDGYERMKAVAEDATDVLEDTYANASKGATDYTLKSIEIARANTNAAFDFASQLMTVRSFSEAVELTSTHTRKQFDAFVEQSKELTALAQRVATETTEPIKSGVSKAFKVAA
jgi:phasin